jgi:Glycosyltransferase like family
LIAFGTSVGEAEPYRRFAEPGIRRAAEPDSEVLAFASVGTIGRTYNLLLEAAAAYDDLEALVLVHSYTEIDDPDFCAKVRRALGDPGVGVVGAAGATGARSIAWWEGAVSAPSVLHRYREHGGGDLPGFGWADPEAPAGEAEAVDGFLLVLSPWTVRNVRFDEALALGHGFDLDLCLRVREAGRRVMTADLRAIHHGGIELISDLEVWVEAHIQMAEKWDGRMPGVPADPRSWKERARRAEAEREAARALAFANTLGADARVLGLERAIAEATDSFSWRITAPLRKLNKLRADALERRRRKP